MDEREYENWKQTDPYLNHLEAWPAGIFPEAKWHYFKESGCLITSLSIMLCRFRIEQECDPKCFNPWILNERLKSIGAFTPAADLFISDICKLYPVVYTGELPCSKQELVRLLGAGTPFLVTVPGIRGDRHFVVPDRLTDDGLIIIDPLRGKTVLTESDIIIDLRVFQIVSAQSLLKGYDS